MTYKSNNKNMSSMSGRSYEHKEILGSDSEDGFSDDFNSIGGRGGKTLVNINGHRLGKDSFGGVKGKRAMVVFGEITTFKGEYELTVNAEPREVVLSWSDNCNLSGEGGISCDDGSGWAGWDDVERCYLRYDSDILQNEYVMRILSLEDSTPKSHESNIEAEEYVGDVKCPFVISKGSRKGELCSKKTMRSLGGVLYCKKHFKRTKKVSNASSINKTDKDNEVVEGGVEDKQMGCLWELTRGINKGLACGSYCKPSENYCKKHTKLNSKQKESMGKRSENKIENSDTSDSQSVSMTSNTDSKNMVAAITSALSEIFTGALRDKYSKKVLEVLQSDKTQETLVTCVNDNTVTKTIKKRGKSRKKDPDAPKKNCSSYIFFCKDTRANIKAEHKDWKGVDVTRELGRIWREDLTDDDKVPFIQQADKDKERYQKEMEDYTPSPEWVAQQGSDDLGGNKKRAKKTRKGPKRAMSAYLYFCQDMRQTVKDNNDGFSAKDVTRELGRIWREEVNCDKKASKKYHRQAKKDKSRYEDEKANWVESDEDEDMGMVTPKPKKTPKVSSSDKSDSDSPNSDSDSPRPNHRQSAKNTPQVSSDDESDSDSPRPNHINKNPSLYDRFYSHYSPDMLKRFPEWSQRRRDLELKKVWSDMDKEERDDCINL